MLPRCNPRRHTFYDLKARSLVRVGGGAKAGTAVSAVLTARRVSLATLLLIAGSFGLQQALAAPGDTRTLWLHHIHTKEEVQITFKRNGQFDEEGLKKINWALRDWRTDAPIKMDPEVIDLLWEVYRDTGAKQPIHIIGGYRSPATNSMLRSRSKGVAKHSQHTLGKAIDFFIPGVPLDVLRAAAMKAQGGGVGYYPTSGSPFVHLDVGSVRAWPRMTREQLAKLFPDGRTVHLPPDGNPLPGYQLALADLERGQRTRDAAAEAQPARFAVQPRQGRRRGRRQHIGPRDRHSSARFEPEPAPRSGPHRCGRGPDDASGRANSCRPSASTCCG